ncbi:MAG: ubiquinone/menaquinone biosynthesis methyltransferase [Acidobacteriia bacterium]|nr:ubiquinone/menaquinone biosynthesis methyltransferase [Terriglobia bacterium]
MRDMFSTIAPKYDLITRVFSYGMDQRWKRLAVRSAMLPARARVLDLACGTGDFAKLVAQVSPETSVTAADLTETMLRLSKLRQVVCADAALLPFADDCFDAVFVGYGLRNFPRLTVAIDEVRRVLKPGGVLVSLDFFLPSRRWLRRFYLAYLYAQGAFWGLILHRRARVYTYIPDSLQSFLSAKEFSNVLEKMQFAGVTARPFILGGIAVHRAKKPSSNSAR